MTLIVSLRIPDGIVLAGDSLSTMMSQVAVQGEVSVTCPQCGLQHKVGPVQVAHIAMPSTTYSFAQKVFPFFGEFGVGTYGVGQLMGKTIYFAVRELEHELKASGSPPKNVMEAADVIGQRALSLVHAQVTDFEKAADDWSPLGFQVVGYDSSEAKTVVISVGKTVRSEVFSQLGCTRSGQGHVVDALWALYRQRPDDQAQYSVFSLQDAIAYAEFLIGTTAAYQRFSRTIPSVGGDIDIALVTPFDRFRWIRKKPLADFDGGPNGK